MALASLLHNFAEAQPYPVSVSISIAPPYSSHISDYIEQPNKIMATLVNTGNSAVSLSLQGSISSESGIRVYTDPSYRMPSPLIIPAYGSVMLSRINIGQVFDADHLIYEGVTANEILGWQGLPEDDYVICLQAFDFATMEPLSAEEPSGCSAPFTVTDLEPPVILQPSCGAEIVPSFPQQIVFSWTRPPNSPPRTQFILKIVEVLPSDRDINDAMQSASHPVFFEKTIPINNYLLGPADAALVEGKKYAFSVTALDPEKKTVFRNHGESEVCSFDYQVNQAGNEVEPAAGQVGLVDLGLFQDQFELVPGTTIKGRLLAKFPTNPDGTVSIGNQNIQLGSPALGKPYMPAGAGNYSYSSLTGNSLIVQGNVNINNLGFGNPYPPDNGAPYYLNQYGLPMLQKMKSMKFIFGSAEDMTYTKPLPNTRVKLVVRLAVLNMGTFGQDFPSDYGGVYPVIDALDLEGKYRQDAVKYLDVVLATTYTDDQGNYTFDFTAPFFTGPMLGSSIPLDLNKPIEGYPFGSCPEVFPGTSQGNINPLVMGGANPNFTPGQSPAPQQMMKMQFSSDNAAGYICLKVEVDNDKFCSPDIDVFAMPGAIVDLPVQVARLKTYDLTVKAISSDKKNQLNGAGNPLAGAFVKVFRDTNHLKYEIPLILNYEGQKLKTNTFNANGAFKDIAAGITDIKGEVKFYNMVRHALINPQYLIDISTRDFTNAETYYDFTFYNYEGIFTGIETNPNTNAIMKPYPKVVYNHEYLSPTQVTITYTLKPLNPEIKGRIMVASNLENAPLSDVNVLLLNQQKSSSIKDNVAFINECYGYKESWAKSNYAGFFRFTDLFVDDVNKDNKVMGPFRRVFISVPGYKWVIIPPLSELPYLLSYGQLKDIKDVNLEAAQMLDGYVEDEDGQSVPAYVKSKYSPYFKTVKKVVSIGGGGGGKITLAIRETFEIPSEPGGAVVTVEPLSSQYFSRDTTTNHPDQKLKVIVYKRLHRPSITVRNQQGQPVKGAKVEIDEYSGVTDSQGNVRFKFAAADDQFVIRIIPPPGSYPVQEPIYIPVSAAYKSYDYVVKRAKSISGYITDKKTSQPIAGALVYAELKQTDGIPLYISAKSGTGGFYELGGIPSTLTSLPVHVVKEGGNPAYEGIVKTITFSETGRKISYDFALEPIEGWNLDDIWNFPVAIENFDLTGNTPGQEPKAKISGYFHHPPAISGFALIEEDQKLHFKELEVVRTQDGKAEPVNSFILLDVLDLPVKVHTVYTGHLYELATLGSGYNIITGTSNTSKNKLRLVNNEISTGVAGIRGQVEMNLSSFKIANEFKGDLYIGDTESSGKSWVFSGSPVPGIGAKHFVFSLGEGLLPVPLSGYRVFNFNADADPGLSFIEGTQVRLKTILHTAIPGCVTCPPLDLKIKAGDLVIAGNEISFQESQAEKLNFELEKWKVYSQKEWYFDKNEESIVLPEVLVITGQGVDARVTGMKIRPNALKEGSISLNGGLTLGGIADLVLSGSLKPIFNYDQTIGHYRISIVGQTDKPAATVSNLPNTSPPVLEFKSIGMLSNDETVMTIGKKYRFFNIIDMYVDQIMSGPGFFKLNGQPDPGIPHFVGQSAVMSYVKPGKKLEGKMEPIKGYIECKGDVEFILDEQQLAQTVKPGNFTSYGNVKIKPGPGQAGNPFYLRGHLSKTNDTCGINIILVDNQKLYAGSNPQEMIVGPNVIRVTQGNTKVLGNDWVNLKYRGNTQSIEGLNDPKANNLLDFEVKGAIDINSNNISVTNINTPLGAMALVYNFDESSLTGTLTISNLSMGFAGINSGLMNVRFDAKGYYLVFAGDVTLGVTGQYAGGFIVGKTSQVRQEHYKPMLSNFAAAYQPGFAKGQGLKGFYVIGERKLIDITFPLVVPVSAKAGIGAYVTANFSANTEFTLGGYGYANFKAGVDFELCCFCLCNGAMFELNGGYSNGGFNIQNCATTYVSASMCGLTLSEGFKMDVSYHTGSGFDFDLGLGSCGGNVSSGGCY